jgi:hypothetical protein
MVQHTIIREKDQRGMFDRAGNAFQSQGGKRPEEGTIEQV